MGTDRFYSNELSEDQKYRVGQVQYNFSMIYDYIDEFIPEGREKSLYITKMEEACMWAVKAISREVEIREEKQVEEDKRICSECAKVISSGYYVDANNGEYYCTEECLHKHHTKEEYMSMYNHGDAYYTEW